LLLLYSPGLIRRGTAEDVMHDERVQLRASEPIFPVADVVETVRYYRNVLGFQEGWT
jgi:hypothetical protein